jgi:hypothetical protein
MSVYVRSEEIAILYAQARMYLQIEQIEGEHGDGLKFKSTRRYVGIGTFCRNQTSSNPSRSHVGRRFSFEVLLPLYLSFFLSFVRSLTTTS